MKKFGVVLAIIAIIALAGCGSGGGGGGGGGAEPFIVDLSTLTQMEILDQDAMKLGGTLPGVRNTKPFAKNWQGMILKFPENMIDPSKYQRLTVVLKYFNANGDEITPADSMGMCVILYTLAGDWFGPAMGPGPNTPVKEMNIGGFSGMINKDRGVRVGLSKSPEGIFIQKAQDPGVAFIELSKLVFHNGNYESPK